jgi:hypothetical protein
VAFVGTVAIGLTLFGLTLFGLTLFELSVPARAQTPLKATYPRGPNN